MNIIDWQDDKDLLAEALAQLDNNQEYQVVPVKEGLVIDGREVRIEDSVVRDVVATRFGVVVAQRTVQVQIIGYQEEYLRSINENNKA